MFVCAMSIIGDEYHAFFKCSNPNVSLQRTRFIPLYFRRNCSMFNFVKLLQSVCNNVTLLHKAFVIWAPCGWGRVEFTHCDLLHVVEGD